MVFVLYFFSTFCFCFCSVFSSFFKPVFDPLERIYPPLRGVISCLLSLCALLQTLFLFCFFLTIPRHENRYVFKNCFVILSGLMFINLSAACAHPRPRRRIYFFFRHAQFTFGTLSPFSSHFHFILIFHFISLPLALSPPSFQLHLPLYLHVHPSRKHGAKQFFTRFTESRDIRIQRHPASRAQAATGLWAQPRTSRVG